MPLPKQKRGNMKVGDKVRIKNNEKNKTYTFNEYRGRVGTIVMATRYSGELTKEFYRVQFSDKFLDYIDVMDWRVEKV